MDSETIEIRKKFLVHLRQYHPTLLDRDLFVHRCPGGFYCVLVATAMKRLRKHRRGCVTRGRPR
jgi:hypothetical protein